MVPNIELVSWTPVFKDGLGCRTIVLNFRVNSQTMMFKFGLGNQTTISYLGQVGGIQY